MGGRGGHVEGKVGLLAQVSTPALVDARGGGRVGGTNSGLDNGACVCCGLQHLGVVVVGVGAVDVAPTVIQDGGVPHGILRQVAPID